MTVSAPNSGSSVPSWRHVDPPALPKILSSALDAFYENGFHGSSVRDIAKRAGVTIAALYYHYENKESLLLALLEYSASDVLARVQAASASADEDPVRRLVNVIEAVVLSMTIRSRLAAVEGEVRYLSPESRLRYRAVQKGIENVVLGILEDGQARGVFSVTDPKEITRAMLAMCQSIPRWYKNDGPFSPDVLAQKYVKIALAMVACASEAAAPSPD